MDNIRIIQRAVDMLAILGILSVVGGIVMLFIALVLAFMTVPL